MRLLDLKEAKTQSRAEETRMKIEVGKVSKELTRTTDELNRVRTQKAIEQQEAEIVWQQTLDTYRKTLSDLTLEVKDLEKRKRQALIPVTQLIKEQEERLQQIKKDELKTASVKIEQIALKHELMNEVEYAKNALHDAKSYRTKTKEAFEGAQRHFDESKTIFTQAEARRQQTNERRAEVDQLFEQYVRDKKDFESAARQKTEWIKERESDLEKEARKIEHDRRKLKSAIDMAKKRGFTK